jgi:hypothetical protein
MIRLFLSKKAMLEIDFWNSINFFDYLLRPDNLFLNLRFLPDIEVMEVILKKVEFSHFFHFANIQKVVRLNNLFLRFRK